MKVAESRVATGRTCWPRNTDLGWVEEEPVACAGAGGRQGSRGVQRNRRMVSRAGAGARWAAADWTKPRDSQAPLHKRQARHHPIRSRLSGSKGRNEGLREESDMQLLIRRANSHLASAPASTASYLTPPASPAHASLLFVSRLLSSRQKGACQSSHLHHTLLLREF